MKNMIKYLLFFHKKMLRTQEDIEMLEHRDRSLKYGMIFLILIVVIFNIMALLIILSSIIYQILKNK
jgi:hypothetical protein